MNSAASDVGSTVKPERIVVIGSGTMFFSGISQYTYALTCALSNRHDTAVILMRRLVPKRLYPGAGRVGSRIANHEYPASVRVYDGVDWYWFPSLILALILMWRERPTVVIPQWWTGAVAHSYLVLMLAARLRGARVVLELHEIQDTGEARIPGAALYARTVFRLMMPLIDAFVTHSEADRDVVAHMTSAANKRIEVIRHGPFDQYEAPRQEALRTAPANAVNIMFFGTIRPYKGLEDLVEAFGSLPDSSCFWLTVIGETWEGWTLPAEMIERSPHAERITFINRYVTEQEASRWLAGADALVLPYHRSSASGPLHIGMALGLPIVTTAIPALEAAAAGYHGCEFVPPRNVSRLREALAALERRSGTVYEDPCSWDETVNRLESLLEVLRTPVSDVLSRRRRGRSKCLWRNFD